MWKPGDNFLPRYGLAFLATGLALALNALIEQTGLKIPFLLFYFAALLSARLGGMGPGWLSAALGTAFFAIRPYHALAAGDLVAIQRLWTFPLVSFVTTTVVAALADARRDAEALGRARVAVQDDLARSETWFRDFVENCPSVAYLKDLDGRFLMINKQCEKTFGIRREDVVGKTDHDFFDGPVADKIRANDLEVLRSGKPEQWEEELESADGARTFLSSKFALRDKDGNPYVLSGISTDITERKKAERELREMKEAAEAASRAKGQFMAVLSHELRTPLTPILMAVTALRGENPTIEEIGSTLDMIRRNIELEAKLIDDLLDLMRIDQGKMHLDRRVVCAHELIEHTLDICRSEIEAGELRLLLELAAPSHHVEADAARLQQVVWNLVKNAVKFSPSGGMLAIRTRNESEEGSPVGFEGSNLIIEISDSGIGIGPEILPRIFEPFEQGEASMTRRFGGLGLGLAICRSVVDAHGGRLSAASPGDGAGSTFTIALSAVPAPSHDGEVEGGSSDGESRSFASPTSSASRRDAYGSRSLNFLLVEDDEDTLRIMERLLTMHGHQVRTTRGLGEALKAARVEHFDVLVSDIGLADGSGLDLIRRLGADRPVVCIALSGYGSEQDIQSSRAAGFSAHLTKPINFLKLEEVALKLASSHALKV